MTKEQLQIELEHAERCFEIIYENCKVIDVLSDFGFDEATRHNWKIIRNHTTKEFKDFSFDNKVALATDYTTYFRNGLLGNKNLKKRELNKLMKEIEGD